MTGSVIYVRDGFCARVHLSLSLSRNKSDINACLLLSAPHKKTSLGSLLVGKPQTKENLGRENCKPTEHTESEKRDASKYLTPCFTFNSCNDARSDANLSSIDIYISSSTVYRRRIDFLHSRMFFRTCQTFLPCLYVYCFFSDLLYKPPT